MTAKEFIMSFPERINPEALAGKDDTVFHFQISGGEGGEFTCKHEGGKFTVEEGLQGEAKCVVSTSDKTLMKIVSGKSAPMMAVMTGKLKISNLTELTKFAKPLGLM